MTIVALVSGFVSLVLLGWATGCAAQSIAWLRLAKRAAGAASGDAIVAGAVVADEPAAVAEISQQRTKAQSGHCWRWQETSFRSISRRFALRADAGELIDVVPEDPVLLLWPPDHTVADGDDRRKRITRLEPDMHVEVLGWLDAAAVKPDAAAPYRDGATATLAPPRRLPMLVSRTPLAPRLRSMGWFQLKRAALLIGLLAIVQASSTQMWTLELRLIEAHGRFPTTRLVVGIAGAILAFACRRQRPPWDIGQSADEFEPRKRVKKK